MDDEDEPLRKRFKVSTESSNWDKWSAAVKARLKRIFVKSNLETLDPDQTDMAATVAFVLAGGDPSQVSLVKLGGERTHF